MNRLFVTLVVLFTVLTASSQKIYFVYLQSDPQQPFFVKMNDKLLSSSATGYLVLPRLKDSTYTFSIGINGGGEHKFNCIVNKKDRGFLVKNFGEKGWGLYDLQTSAVEMEVGSGNKSAMNTGITVNAFTDLLSKASDDSTLRQKVVLPAENANNTTTVTKTENKESQVVATPQKTTEVKTVTQTEKNAEVTKPEVKQAARKDDVVVPETSGAEKTNVEKQVETNTASATKTADLKTQQEKIETTPRALTVTEKEKVPDNVKSVTNTSFAKTKVIQKSESSTTEGFGLTYIDTYSDGKRDTISLVIPNDNRVKLSDSKPAKGVAEKSGNTNEKTVTKPIAKNACKAVATDDDFFKLRKKMAAEKSDNGMIEEAGKVFKAKCFTTLQLKNLSTLFIGDGGKYEFFDNAYTHVADIENFATLQSELKDEYFVNRFKAMLR